MPGSQQTRLKRTRPLYDKLLEAFRERPGNVSYASRQAGVHRDAAKNAWERGWKGISWARPIKAVVQDEGDEAAVEAAKQRASREAAKDQRRASEDADRERARAERVRVLAEEIQIQAAMRGSVRQAAGVVLALGPAMSQLVQVVVREVFDVTQVDGKPVLTPKASPKVDAKGAMSIMSRWGTLMGKVAIAGELVVQLGRETRGPDEVVGGPEMSSDEARDEIEHLTSIWEGIKQREAEDKALEAAATPPDAAGPPPGETVQ